MNSFNWQPIEDYVNPHETLGVKELHALKAVWDDQKSSLIESENYQIFLERLKREWAIETGILEHIYTLSRGITILLIERGIDAARIDASSTNQDPELVAAMIRDHKSVIDALFDFVKGNRSLSTSYIKELHQEITKHQDTVTAIKPNGNYIKLTLIKGDYKKLPNNPQREDGSIHEYCPPEHVASEMDRLIQLYNSHLENDVPTEVEAAWLHHRFSQIHPFQDGNGRIARCMASLHFIKNGWFPLVISRDDRDRYITALEIADRGHIKPLVELFALLQKKAFLKALSISEQVRKQEHVVQIIDSIRDERIEQLEQLRKEWDRSKTLTLVAQDRANSIFSRTAKELISKLGTMFSSNSEFFTDFARGDDTLRNYYYRYQIINTAKELNYYANLHYYKAWSRVVLRTDSTSEILLLLHGFGYKYRGIIAVSCCYSKRADAGDESSNNIVDVIPLSDDVFQINYKDDEEEMLSRFEVWLNECLSRGLIVWKKGLLGE